MNDWDTEGQLKLVKKHSMTYPNYKSSSRSAKKNPQFYYKFYLDSNNVVKNVFWSHASQQGDYKGI